jgi:hypothetical protein
MLKLIYSFLNRLTGFFKFVRYGGSKRRRRNAQTALHSDFREDGAAPPRHPHEKLGRLFSGNLTNPLITPLIKHWQLMLILVIGLLVRCWGLSFGLPLTETRPEETVIVSRAIAFFSGDFNPHYFAYPSLYFYLVFALYFFYFTQQYLLGYYRDFSDLVQAYFVDATPFYLINRGLSVGLGTATIAMIYLIVNRLPLKLRKQVAIATAFIYSITYLPVREAHFGMTDTAFTFGVCLSLYWIIKTYQERRLKHYCMTGLMVGLTTSLKYPGLLLIVPLLIVHALYLYRKLFANQSQATDRLIASPNLIPQGRHYLGLAMIGLVGVGSIATSYWITPELLGQVLRPAQGVLVERDRLEAWSEVVNLITMIIGWTAIISALLWVTVKGFAEFFNRQLLGFGTGICLGLMSTSPFIWLDFKSFAIEFLNNYVAFNPLSETITRQSTEYGWLYYSAYSIPLAFGLPFCVAIVLGIWKILRFNRHDALILLAFPIVYYSFMGQGHRSVGRHILPLMPYFCLLVAIALIHFSHALSEQLAQRFNRPLYWQRAIALFLFSLVLLHSLTTTFQFNHLIAQRDNRLVVRDWIYGNIPSGRSLYQTGVVVGQLPLDQTGTAWRRRVAAAEGHWLSPLFSSLSRPLEQHYPDWLYDSNTQTFSLGGVTQLQPPDYILRQDYPLPGSSKVLPSIEQLLQRSYQLKKVFTAIEPTKQQFFDQFDLFYLPFTGFDQVQRPGANYYLYERHQSDRP